MFDDLPAWASFGMLLGVLWGTAGQCHGDFEALDQCDGEKERKSEHQPSTVWMVPVKAELFSWISIVSGSHCN